MSSIKDFTDDVKSPVSVPFASTESRPLLQWEIAWPGRFDSPWCKWLYGTGEHQKAREDPDSPAEKELFLNCEAHLSFVGSSAYKNLRWEINRLIDEHAKGEYHSSGFVCWKYDESRYEPMPWHAALLPKDHTFRLNVFVQKYVPEQTPAEFKNPAKWKALAELIKRKITESGVTDMEVFFYEWRNVEYR